MSTLIVIFLVFILIFLVLTAPRMWKKPDYEPILHHHYAHRGLFHVEQNIPENSLPAFQNAVEQHFGIELDVQLSKDGIPVVFHDNTLERMCHVPGKVSDFTLRELQNLSLDHTEYSIPTLEHVLQIVNGNVPLIIEIKMDHIQKKLCPAIHNILIHYTGPYCIESFHPYVLLWYRLHHNEVVRGQLVPRPSNLWKAPLEAIRYAILASLFTNVFTRPDFIAAPYDYKNMACRLCHQLGAFCAAWTIRSREAYERSKNQFDILIFEQ